MTDTRGFLERVVYSGERQRRFIQQSPIMPDVWIRYGMNPGSQQELLLVPNWHFSTADLASGVKARLKSDKKHVKSLQKFRQGDGTSASIAFNQNVVVANLWFDELIRAVLPLSRWWRYYIARIESGKQTRDLLVDSLKDAKTFEKVICDCLEREEERGLKSGKLEYDVIWFARIAGLLCRLSEDETSAELKTHEKSGDEASFLEELLADHKKIAQSAAKLLKQIQPIHSDDPYPLFSVNINRLTSKALYQSVPCIKADAASRVFEVKGKGVRWAVIDSGIDARHIAFRKRKPDGEVYKSAFTRRKSTGRSRARKATPNYDNNTRIHATYDFVHIRELLGCDPEEIDALIPHFPMLKDDDAKEELRGILESMKTTVINWERLEKFLRIEHIPAGARNVGPNKYRPGGEHGTHVAGILAADWRATDDPGPRSASDLFGVCPEMELYDLRVLDKEGVGNEFAIMSALQFVRFLNNRRDFVAIHGVNLSFSINHDVANYACGRTPVCDEAELLVRNGVIAVAAAGNSGRARYLTPTGTDDDGFRTVSITDPGNAAAVITVGSTHRGEPHNYGVSYFSSRGPTGDGRAKPDLVAPGEKILSCFPNNSDAWLDGTSMAAPHVSGAAALIISRYPEFIGQPERIKQILCSTATDLGRERYYQGAGLLDVLRAMQSI